MPVNRCAIVHTTTAAVLPQAIFREGVQTVAAGANPMAVKRGMEKAVAYSSISSSSPAGARSVKSAPSRLLPGT
jgi:hypothetical protein